jgi:hypothetical protein
MRFWMRALGVALSVAPIRSAATAQDRAIPPGKGVTDCEVFSVDSTTNTKSLFWVFDRFSLMVYACAYYDFTSCVTTYKVPTSQSGPPTSVSASSRGDVAILIIIKKEPLHETVTACRMNDPKTAICNTTNWNPQ